MSDETGWLCEMSELGQILYWEIDPRSDDGGGWTPDANKAIRFARKVDAENFIADIGWTDATAVEHMWCALKKARVMQTTFTPDPPEARPTCELRFIQRGCGQYLQQRWVFSHGPVAEEWRDVELVFAETQEAKKFTPGPWEKGAAVGAGNAHPAEQGCNNPYSNGVGLNPDALTDLYDVLLAIADADPEGLNARHYTMARAALKKARGEQ
jgi:hypothetical protein